MLLRRVKIYRELLERLVLDTSLNVWYVESLANRLNVPAEQRIAGPENSLNSEL